MVSIFNLVGLLLTIFFGVQLKWGVNGTPILLVKITVWNYQCFDW